MLLRTFIVAMVTLGSCGCSGTERTTTQRSARRATTTGEPSPATPRASPTTTATPTSPATSAAVPATSASPTPGTGADGLRLMAASVRLANFYVDASGEGAKVDAYWGSEARPDRLVATLPYGQLSDATAARGTGVEGSDGSPPQVIVSFFVAGRRSEADRIAVASTDEVGRTRLIVELSWSRSYTTPPPGALRPASTQVIREDQVDPISGGNAAVIVNNLGAMAIGDGTPLQLGPVAACGSWTSISDEFENGNAGENSFLAPPGPTRIAAFSADCRVASSPLRLDLRPGDRVVVFVYGPTAATRRLVAVPIS